MNNATCFTALAPRYLSVRADAASKQAERGRQNIGDIVLSNNKPQTSSSAYFLGQWASICIASRDHFTRPAVRPFLRIALTIWLTEL
jgi:hypothetical protein